MSQSYFRIEIGEDWIQMWCFPAAYRAAEGAARRGAHVRLVDEATGEVLAEWHPDGRVDRYPERFPQGWNPSRREEQ
jgi:hypothetical protein